MNKRNNESNDLGIDASAEVDSAVHREYLSQVDQ